MKKVNLIALSLISFLPTLSHGQNQQENKVSLEELNAPSLTDLKLKQLEEENNKKDEITYNPFNPKAEKEKVVVKNDRNILIVGDSLSTEYNIEKDSGWVALLNNYYKERGRDYNFINISINGLDTKQAISILDKALFEHKPKIVILGLGSTDMLKGINIDEIRNNLNILIQDIELYQAKPILLGLELNGSRFNDKQKEDFKRMYLTLSTQKNIAFVPKFFKSLNDTQNWTRNFHADQFHPNQNSQITMQRNVLYVIDRMIQELFPEKQQRVRIVRETEIVKE